MPVIFLDLDGVLVDFVGGVCSLFGKENPYTKPEAQGQWGLEDLLGIDPADFWRPLGHLFWRRLARTSDHEQILAAVEQAAGGPQNVCLLTSPCDTWGCLEGKREWISEHLPQYRRQVLFGAAKHFAAGPGKILVDDSDANITAWTNAGGIGVTVARPWNRLHQLSGVAVERLKVVLHRESKCQTTPKAAA